MYNPEDEQDVYVYADIEVSCWNCDKDEKFDDAELAGNQHELCFAWTCDNCGYKNTKEYDTRNYA